jgi:hypothetical protein
MMYWKSEPQMTQMNADFRRAIVEFSIRGHLRHLRSLFLAFFSDSRGDDSTKCG